MPGRRAAGQAGAWRSFARHRAALVALGRPCAHRAGLVAVPAPPVASSGPRELAGPAPGAQLGAPARHGPARTRRAGADPGRHQDLLVGGAAGHRDRRHHRRAAGAAHRIPRRPDHGQRCQPGLRLPPEHPGADPRDRLRGRARPAAHFRDDRRRHRFLARRSTGYRGPRRPRWRAKATSRRVARWASGPRRW